MKVIGIIPARMGSTRFPGKPLAKILEFPMIEHVYKRSKMSKELSDLYVATCDEEIREAVENFGGKVIMTSPKHERCTDRIAEASQTITADIIVNIQGDEPLLYPEMIDLALKPMIEDKNILCCNLISPIRNVREFNDLNEIKVVINRDNFALFFSREPIPTNKRGIFGPAFKQVCIIPFRKEFLLKFVQMEPTLLEKAESIDMLRVLEHGYSIKTVISNWETYSVDTLDDLTKVEKIMKADSLFNRDYYR